MKSLAFSLGATMNLLPTTQRGQSQLNRQAMFDQLRKETKWRPSRAIKSREAKIQKTLISNPKKEKQ